jgi:DNA-binding NtrC family response regulator
LLLDDFQDSGRRTQVTLLDLLRFGSNKVSATPLGGTRPWQANVQVILAVNEPVEKLRRDNRIGRDVLARTQRIFRLHPLRDLLREAGLNRSQRRDLLRLALLEMQEQAITLVPSAFRSHFYGDSFDDLLRAAFGLMDDLSRRDDMGFRERTPLPDEVLDHDWPANFRDLDDFARRLMQDPDRPALGRWNDQQARKALRGGALETASRDIDRVAGDQATLQASPDDTPMRLMGLALLKALGRAPATFAEPAEKLGVDRRTMQKILRTLIGRASPSRTQWPIEAMVRSLTPDEREALRRAAHGLLKDDRAT